jgi:uncharacterized protein (DUF1501 family)
MPMSDERFEDAYRAVCAGPELSRRRLIAGMGALGALGVLDATPAAAAARSLGAGRLLGARYAPQDRVLVLVMLGGGMDGLGVLVPHGDQAALRSLRPGMAIEQAATVAVPGSDLGLSSRMRFVRDQMHAGRVSLVPGVSYPNPSFSHFDSMAFVMSGHANGASERTGWVGRWADDARPGDLGVIAVGDQLPRHLIGRTDVAVSIPSSLGTVFGSSAGPAHDQRLVASVRNQQASGRSAQEDAWVRTASRATALGSRLAPLWSGLPDDRGLARDMMFAARLVNLDAGTRVVNVNAQTFQFDTHAGQYPGLDGLLDDLDAGLAAFFAELAPEHHDRVAVLCWGEFGRTPWANGSQGTDHGTSQLLFAVGSPVASGVRSSWPRLPDRPYRAFGHEVDVRGVWSEAITWLGGDGPGVVGGWFDSPGVLDHGADRAPRSSFGRSGAGYWLVETSGAVRAFGGATNYGSGAGMTPAAVAATPARDGYVIAGRDGRVQAFGGANHHGDMAGRRMAAPVVGLTCTTGGYWLLAADGGIFSFGSSRFHGSMGGRHLGAPVVAMASTPTGNGYWLVASDGGIFAFGDARFFGSMGGARLNAPVVGMAATVTGNGYWLVASDGGMFAFGDAAFHGSMGGRRLNRPMIGMVPTATGGGYFMVADDGGVFAFGDASFVGSAADSGRRYVGLAA